MKGFLAAVQFLTRIPVRTRDAPSLAASVPWFPAVGLVVGAFVGGVAAGMTELSTPFVAAAVAVIAGLLVTGAFHEDGLADLSDAVAGGWTRERRLEILKDPRHGTYGVAALCGSVIVRVAAVASITSSGQLTGFGALVAAHGLARATAVGAMITIPTATTDGLGARFAREVGPLPSLVGVGAALVVSAVAVGPAWAVVVMLVAACAGGAVVVVARRAIGGITGDVLGAIEQVAECAALIAASALASHFSPWWD